VLKYDFNILIHYISDALHYPPPEEHRRILLNAFINQKFDVTLHIIADNLRLCEQKHVHDVDCVHFNFLGLVWVQ
jgi:hypothetical protein